MLFHSLREWKLSKDNAAVYIKGKDATTVCFKVSVRLQADECFQSGSKLRGILESGSLTVSVAHADWRGKGDP